MSGALSLLLKKLQSDSRRYLSRLDPLTRHELSEYQQGSWINDALRRNLLPETALPVRERLDSALQEAPTLPEDLRVYRGAPRGVYPGLERGYLSTSLRKDEAANFLEPSSELYSIDVEGGTPYLMPLNLNREWGGQQELIFPRNSMLLREPSTGALNYLFGGFR